MTSDPRAALDQLIFALEAHLAAATRRSGETDPDVVAAYQRLADAFERYDEALYDAYDEVTPFVLYDDAEDAADDEDEDDLDEDEDDLDDQVVLDEDDDDYEDEGADDEDLDEDLDEAADESETPVRAGGPAQSRPAGPRSG